MHVNYNHCIDTYMALESDALKKLIISQSDTFFKTCRIPHQDWTFKILPNLDLNKISAHNYYAFSGYRIDEFSRLIATRLSNEHHVIHR